MNRPNRKAAIIVALIPVAIAVLIAMKGAYLSADLARAPRVSPTEARRYPAGIYVTLVASAQQTFQVYGGGCLRMIGSDLLVDSSDCTNLAEFSGRLRDGSSGSLHPAAIDQVAKAQLGMPNGSGLRVLAVESAASMHFQIWIAFGFALLLGAGSLFLLLLIARGVLPRPAFSSPASQPQ